MLRINNAPFVRPIHEVEARHATTGSRVAFYLDAQGDLVVRAKQSAGTDREIYALCWVDAADIPELVEALQSLEKRDDDAPEA